MTATPGLLMLPIAFIDIRFVTYHCRRPGRQAACKRSAKDSHRPIPDAEGHYAAGPLPCWAGLCRSAALSRPECAGTLRFHAILCTG
jgi:hypothetical protein